MISGMRKSNPDSAGMFLRQIARVRPEGGERHGCSWNNDSYITRAAAGRFVSDKARTASIFNDYYY